MLYQGLIIESHCITDARSKEAATKSLTGWQQKEQSVEDWIHELELGKTIILAEMKQNEDESYSHAEKNFIRTWFVFADADNFSGVEFSPEGVDKNPDGIEFWTERDGLSKRYPDLLKTVFAVQESVSSMKTEIPHRRYRLVFRFDAPIETPDHYRYILSELHKKYPVISPANRQPAQPVFGNGNEKAATLKDNKLEIADFELIPEPEPETAPRAEQTHHSKALRDFLFDHGIDHEVRDKGGFFVQCPFLSGHTDGKQGKTDSYVWEGESGWAFYCSHAHCQNNRTWQRFKEGHGIETKHYVTEPPEPIPEPVRIDASDTSAIPFPVDAIKGTIFGAYEEAYAGRNETCPAFRFAELASVLGTALGRKVSIQSGRLPIYPNMFLCLVGPTGLARKSTSLKASERLIEEIQTDTLQFINSLNTAEGLLKMMVDVEDCRTICILDEFKWLFSKSQNAVAAGLLPILNTLSGSPEIAMNRRSENPYEVIRPHFSFFSSITPGWFAENITRSSIGGGFVNRFVFFLHEQQPFFSDTEVKPPDPEIMKKVRQFILSAAEDKSTTNFVYDGEVANLDSEWYHERMQFLMSADEIVREASSRVDEHMKKFCAMMAWCANEAGDNEVHAETWKSAKAVAEYMIKVNTRLFKNLAVDKMTEQEMRVLKHLDDLGGKTTKSKLSTKIGRQNLSSRDLERILQALVANETIGIFKEERTTFVVRIS